MAHDAFPLNITVGKVGKGITAAPPEVIYKQREPSVSLKRKEASNIVNNNTFTYYILWEWIYIKVLVLRRITNQ